MNIKIRPPRPQDWQILQDLNHRVMFVNKNYDPFFNVDWEYTKPGEKYFQKMAISKDDSCCFIAEADNQPIGYANGNIKIQGYRIDSIKSAEIINIAVLPKFQSKGVGSKLFSAFLIWAKQKQATHLTVDSFYKNIQAIKFYKKLGLKPIDIILEGKI